MKTRRSSFLGEDAFSFSLSGHDPSPPIQQEDDATTQTDILLTQTLHLNHCQLDPAHYKYVHLHTSLIRSSIFCIIFFLFVIKRRLTISRDRLNELLHTVSVQRICSRMAMGGPPPGLKIAADLIGRFQSHRGVSEWCCSSVPWEAVSVAPHHCCAHQ